MIRLLAHAVMGSVLAVSVAMPPGAAGRPATRLHYSPDQASAGEAVYKSECAVCHGNALEGSFETPPLTGRFIANWSGSATLSDLAVYIRKAMPQMAPGTLSADEVAEVIAFLLQKNDVPAGKTSLPADPAALRRLHFPAAGTAR